MSVEMKLELGHRATYRDKPTAEGFTHDWSVFVKGAEGSDIQYFVDKVVFNLHESFHKPKRVVKEPPYEVSESGYAGFMMPIEVHFRSKEEPKKVRFEYDLFLRLEGPAVYNIRREKLTFNNPSEDFRQKLLKARGIGSGPATGSGTPSLQTQTSAPIQHIEEPVPRPPVINTKSPAVAEKKLKTHSAIKDHSHSSHTKPNKVLPPPSGPVVNVPGKDVKSISKVGHSVEVKESKSKPVKPEREQKSTSKRLAPSDSQNHHHGSAEKKKRHHSNSDGNEKHSDSSKVKETKEKKEKHKKSSGHNNKKEKHKASSHLSTTHKDPIKSPPSKPVNNVKLPSSPDRVSNDDSNEGKSSVKPEDGNASSPASDLLDASETWCEISPEKMDGSIERDMLSPMSPDIRHSPTPGIEKLRRSTNHDTEDSLEEKPAKSAKMDRSPKPKSASKLKKPITQINNNNNSNSSGGTVHRNTKQNGTVKENNHISPPTASKATKNGKEALDPTYVRELVDLQKKIMSLEDRTLLQRVVDVIEETGRFQMTSKSFDFDLCRLDQSTVRKLKLCLAP